MTGTIEANGNIQSLMNFSDSVTSACYAYMFRNCTSLITAPLLPATTLAHSCYYYMFASCTALTSAPQLPATTLANYCYYYMFNGCTKLSNIEVALTSWTPTNATTNWVRNIAANGTFTCPTALGTNSSITRGNSNCPTNWTVINK